MAPIWIFARGRAIRAARAWARSWSASSGEPRAPTSPTLSDRSAAPSPSDRSTERLQLEESADQKPADGGAAVGWKLATAPSIEPVSQSPAGVSLLISRSFQRPFTVHAQSKRERKLQASAVRLEAQREASRSGMPRTPR